MAERCQVTLAYAIGMAEPVMVEVDTFGTCLLCADDCLAKAVRQVFDLTPAGMIETLDHGKIRSTPARRWADILAERISRGSAWTRSACC